jgi:hypothetical protein
VPTLANAVTQNLDHAVLTAHPVFTIRHWLKVIGVTARSDSTKVIELQPVGDWSNEVLIHHAVGAQDLGAASDSTVSSLVERARPDPAAI